MIFGDLAMNWQRNGKTALSVAMEKSPLVAM